MERIFKVCIFLIFLMTMADTLRIDYMEDPQETTRQYIFQQMSEIKDLFNEKLKPTVCPKPPPSELEMLAGDYLEDMKFGVIFYKKNSNSTTRPKVWMLQEPNTESLRFSLHDNELGPDYKLTLTGISATGEHDQFIISSQTPNKTEIAIKGFAIVVALTLETEKPGTLYPSFRLLYHQVFSSNPYRWLNSKIITGEGVKEVSLPDGNSDNYPNYASSVILIAPASGKEFKITLKYLDTEVSHDYLQVFSMDGKSTSPLCRINRKPDPCKKHSGQRGVISEIVGYSTAALLFFRSDSSAVGKGYKVEIQPV